MEIFELVFNDQRWILRLNRLKIKGKFYVDTILSFAFEEKPLFSNSSRKNCFNLGFP